MINGNNFAFAIPNHLMGANRFLSLEEVGTLGKELPSTEVGSRDTQDRGKVTK